MAPGKTTLSFDEIKNMISEEAIVSRYLGITKIPCVISSPLRVDNNPSFAIFLGPKDSLRYKDFATGDTGGIYDLLCRMWHCSFKKTLSKLVRDFSRNFTTEKVTINARRQPGKVTYNNEISLQCKIREWRKYDIEYWKSYGVSLKWLKYAEVYPISHKIVIKDDKRYVFGADKYAYAFVERKEGKVTLKIYQPFNKSGFKWASKHDRSVISLWTKLPANGDKVVICSSLKDALCLWANTNIPAIAVQGEGYGISDTAINQLKERFKQVYILFDNDQTGLEDGIKLAGKTGFKNLILPQFEGGKDISDLYKKDNTSFLHTIMSLFEEDKSDFLPF